ncbi:MAG TPA: hypothetical protein VFW27_08600, partial [Actinoplanes sp.]|nr:hypothetical protein [Actinoplanes sp.]
MTTTAPDTGSTATRPVDPAGTAVPDDAAGVLAFAREQRAAADLAERRLLEAAVQWAVIHPAETLDDAEGYATRVHIAGVDEEPMPLAGPGAPLVREFCVAEFAAAVGMGTESGKYYLGHALELRYRLPKCWARSRRWRSGGVEGPAGGGRDHRPRPHRRGRSVCGCACGAGGAQD